MPDTHQAVLIGAAVKNVYDAITTQEGLSAWWTPGTTAIAEINSIARFPFGADYFKEMQIKTLKPFELVSWHCVEGASEWVGTDIDFKLLPVDKKTLPVSYPEIQGQAEQLQHDNATLLIFHHNHWKDDTLMFAECSYTWGQFLKSLKLLCETGKGSPWPYQHDVA